MQLALNPQPRLTGASLCLTHSWGNNAVGALASASLTVGEGEVLCLQPLTEELRSVRKIEWAVVIRSSKLFSVGMLLTFLVGCFCGCLGSLVSCPLNTKSTLLVTVKTGSVPYTFPDVLPGEVLPAAESHSSCRNFPDPHREPASLNY